MSITKTWFPMWIQWVHIINIVKKRIMHVIRTIRDLFLCINDPHTNQLYRRYGLIHIVPCCQLVEQKSEQIVHFLLKAPYLQGVRFLTWQWILHIEPAAKLIFSIAKLTCLYFTYKILTLTRSWNFKFT